MPAYIDLSPETRLKLMEDAAPFMLDAIRFSLDRLLTNAEAGNFNTPADTQVVAALEAAIALAEGR